MFRLPLVTVLSALALFAQAPDQAVSLNELVRINPGAALRQMASREPQAFEGNLSSLTFANPVTGELETRMMLQMGETSYPVYSEQRPTNGCSGLANIRGFQVDGQILAASIQSQGPLNSPACQSTGVQKALVILIESPTLKLPAHITPSYVQSFMMGATPPTVNGYFQEVSGGRTSVSSDTVGPFTLSAEPPCTLNPSLVLTALNLADPSVDLTVYNRIMVIAPRASASCTSRVYSNGCQQLTTAASGALTASWGFVAADLITANPGSGVNLAAKLIGNGLGLGFSYTRTYPGAAVGPFGPGGTDVLDGDHSIMGNFAVFGSVFPLGHLPARQKVDLGWSAAGVDFDNIQANSTTTILASSSPAPGLKALRIRRGTGYNEWLWVEYRRFIGSYDSTLQSWSPTLQNGVLIHHERPTDSPLDTFLLNFHTPPVPATFTTAMLVPGAVWNDPYSNLSLQVTPSTGTGNTAGMQVTATYRPTGGCVYTPSQATLFGSSAAGSNGFTITTGPYCEWFASVAASGANYVTVTSTALNTGTGPVNFNYSANGTGAPRSTTIDITGVPTVTFNQSGTARPALLTLDRTRLNYAGTGPSQLTPPQKVLVTFGGGAAAWTASSDQPWLQVSPTSGTGATRLTVSVNPALLPASGTLTATLTVSAPAATPTSKTVSVYLTKLVTATSPVGWFDTPADNSTGVSGSIPVTGWVLDDIFVSSVQIFRDKIGNEPVQPNGLIYIGDAVFINNARPDTEGLYPALPLSYRGGWGYLMLTNSIPSVTGAQGNGTIKLWAIATDIEGNAIRLGSKTITLNNASSKIPFGAIDQPGQGASVAGVLNNSGWVMTPQPNIMITSPSNIDVVIDSVPVGKVSYGQPRPDVQGFFPGYRNSPASGASFNLDTNLYSSGMHSISWNAYDNVGNAAGIGSRYFFIENGLAGLVEGATPPMLLGTTEPTAITRSARPRPQRGAVPQVRTMQELERLVIDLPEGQWTGAQVINGDLQSLPIGSTLDNTTGAFYWQPGPGFLGRHELLFTSADGAVHGVTVNIEPKVYSDSQ